MKEDMLYIKFLLAKPSKKTEGTKLEERRMPKFASVKGIFKMATNFDESLGDFKDYMPL